jgi:hypothetical protein
VNRYTALFLAALVAIVVACNTDRPMSQQNSGIERVPVSTENITSAAPTFKVQVSGTWYALVRVGDFIAGHPSDSTYVIKSGGTIHSGIATTSIVLDTVGWAAATGQVYLRSPVIPSGDFLPSASPNIPLADVYAPRSDTLMLDSVTATHLYFHEWDAGSIAFSGKSDAFFTQDNVGSFRFYACSSTPTCSFALPAPTNATLANNGPFNAKITWSNNGDTQDSTEIWFGKSGSETKQSVQPPSVTSYVVSFSGPGLYDAWVFHRWNGNISSSAFTNQLSH